jgi:hypothetical protein
MAKIFLISDNLDLCLTTIENFIKKNSGHRKALFQNQADITIELTWDSALGDKNPSMIIFEDNELVSNIGKSIADSFRLQLINSGYPKKSGGSREYPTLVLKVSKLNNPIDEVQYGNIIGEAIVKYLDPEYNKIKEYQSEPTIKASKDKTYYDRAFNQNSTSNASLIFKKKS